MLWVVVLPIRILFTINFLGIFVCNGVNDQFKTVDVVKLANTTHGTGNNITMIIYLF